MSKERAVEEGVITGICRLLADTEVPELFSIWGAISAVSASLGRNVFLDQGHFTVYPNLYIVLTAGSAKCRKSTVINTIDDLLHGVEPSLHLMSQKATPEAIIGDLCGATVEDTTVINTATGIVIADEVSTFIDRNAFASGMIPVLTKLYDCKDFDYRTRSRGNEVIRNPCLSILGGSTIQWIKEAIPVVSIGGGFTARIIFVYQDSRSKNVPWPTRSPELIQLREAIVKDLTHIHQTVRGRFAVTQEAKDAYCEEYINFSNTSKLFEDPNMSGYAGRRHVLVLKLAMCFSASENDSREITGADMGRAIKALFYAEQSMQKVLSAISQEPCGDLSDQVIHLLHSRGKIAKHEFVRTFRRKLTISQIEELMRTLSAAGIIREVVDGSQVFYLWIGKEQQ